MEAQAKDSAASKNNTIQGFIDFCLEASEDKLL
jgi:hypothetical protein